MTEKTRRTLLPFASFLQAEDGILNSDVEKASVFCLAELNREKGGGMFKKQPLEKTVFISKVYYPFWKTPFRGLILLFDGLNGPTYTMTYPTVPDLKAFKENLDQRSSTRQIYVTFLANQLNYFQQSNTEQTKVIEGLISDLEYVKEFMTYLNEGIAATANPIIDGVLVSPTYDEKQIAANLKELEDSRLKAAQELDELNEVIKLLNAKTQHFIVSLKEEIKAMDEKFSVKIENAKAIFTQRKLQLNKEYTDKVTEISNNFEQETVALSKEIIKLEKAREELNSEIEHIETEIKNSAINKDDSTEQKWKEKRNELRKKFPDITTSIKDLEVKIQEIEENKKNELFRLKQESDEKMKDAGKDLLEIQSSLDAEKKICRDDMEKVEELASTISGKIDILTKMREASIEDFEALGIRQESDSNTLVYMPFYLTCYQSKSSRRFSYVEPSLVNSGGLSTRFKAIGKMKITQVFQPRSQKITSILNNFLLLMENNVAFSHEIVEACSKTNILQSKEATDSIKKGLNELKTDGWLSENEFEFFSQVTT